MGTALHRPFLYRSEQSADGYVGTSLELMRILSEKLNYCYHYSVIDGLAPGRLLPNGTWTDGLIKRMRDEQFAFSGVPLSLTREFLTAVDYSHYIQVEEHVILTQYPTLESDYVGFFKPLSNLVRCNRV